MKKFKQLGLIGCGMMGGSFALAAKRAGLVERVVGYSKSPHNTERAKRLGVIDDMAASALQGVMGADLVLVSVPVSATAEVFKALKFGLGTDALIMDVGSTKQSVIQAVEKVFGTLPPRFVPAHPIAGKERAGIDEAEADLYKGKRLILTPTAQTDVDAVTQATEIWQRLGMTVSTMPADAHDAVFAAVSHFPHLLAFAYMNGLAGQKDAADFLAMAGPGFKDFTRIAASDPEIWRDILLANRKEVLKQSGAMLMSLSQLEYAMREGDPKALTDLISRASLIRSAWTMNTQAVTNDV
jgi:prephenate dehydrogenase